MVIGNADGVAVTTNGAVNNNNNNNSNSSSHPSGIPQDKIDNIMSGIANTGDVKMNNHRKKLRQRFDIIKKLGQGTYGKVQLGINKETGQEVAIKTIKKCKIEAEADLVRIRREVQIMSSVQHPNIIHIYEVFENREKMVLVMEFAAGGELYDYLSERKVLSETEARRIFRQVATAVYYCHKHKICHRDLKLENILLDEHGNAKIADFGLSNVFDDQRLLATFCGSPLYASPEIVEGTPYHGPEVDCWSLGVLLYTLVYGSMPFDGSNFKRLVKQISEGDYFEPKKPSRASTLIRDMLTVCPRKRATIEQICSHWWVNENDNLSCLDLAEDLANQTPVRLDVLLSLTPSAITADQLVVPSAEANANAKANERVPRSHSVGSIRDISANTEAERRILDMVAAGGEQALMPSPTRTITPAQSPIQPKRKLETTLSTENASVAVKKEKAGSRSTLAEQKITPVSEEETPMETEEPLKNATEETETTGNLSASFSQKDMEMVKDLCSQLIQEEEPLKPTIKVSSINEPSQGSNMNESAVAAKQRNLGKLDSVAEAPEEKEATKVIKKFVNKHKTADMVQAIGQITPDSNNTAEESSTAISTTSKLPTGAPPFVRKCSLQDESSLNKFTTERRKSRILETAEKFNQLNANAATDKAKKFVIPGVSVGSFKKEFERKATTPTAQGPTAGERRALEEVAAAVAAAKEMEETVGPPANSTTSPTSTTTTSTIITAGVHLDEPNEIKTVGGVAAKEIEQLCVKTENIDVNESIAEPVLHGERERKLQNARAIIGNAIQPVIRRPTTPAQPQLLPPPTSPPSNLYANGGGGGIAQLLRNGMDNFNKTVANGGTTTNSQMPINYNNNNNNNNNNSNNNNVDDKQVPPWLKWPKNKQSQTQKTQLQQQEAPSQQHQEYPINNNINNNHINNNKRNKNIALAAARHNIMSRLTSAPFLSTNINEISTLNTQLNNDYNTTCTTQEPRANNQVTMRNQLLAKQQNHYPPQQVMNRIRQLQRHISVPPLLSNSPCYNNVPITATVTASAIAKNSVPKPFYNALLPPPPPPTTTTTLPLQLPQPLSTSSTLFKSSPGGDTTATGGMKTSSASITLKSATLPRRKTAKTEIQLEIKPRVVEQPAMRFTTEMQHPVADLRSAPARDGPVPFSPLQSSAHARANSLEPKEHIIPISRPPTYTRTTSNTTTRSSGSLSRQSTGDSESDTNTTTNMSQSTVTGSSQPIKKSPREFIIPIAVEGGGIITPREGSIEPSESSHTTTSSRSTFSRLKPTRRIGSLLNNSAVDEESPFPKMRTSSSTRDTEDDPRFTLHRLRSTRPTKKVSQDNDSASSGEEDDDDDGFEILTAENLFSTLLQRVRALTNRMNVNNDITSGFPNSSRLFNSMRSGQSSLWDQDPFRSRLNNTPWRHSLAGRDLDTDMDSIFSRTGATLPRGNKSSKISKQNVPNASNCYSPNSKSLAKEEEEPLDLADLDLSRLRLSKKDLETLSNIAPGLPKCFQEQLLAKLPPMQARKLSRTLSMQDKPPPNVTIYKRSQSSGRGIEQNCPLTSKNVEHSTDLNFIAPASSSRTSDKSSGDRNLTRRSVSRTRTDYETNIPTPLQEICTPKSRSNSVCREDFYNNKSLCMPCENNDISEKYKYYSPYLVKTIPKENVSIAERYGEMSNTVGITAAAALPPSGYLSPTSTTNSLADGQNGSLRRRASQRRISRFLRPDFFEEPLDENPYMREKKSRERETQNVLREIREKSREPSRDRLSNAEIETIEKTQKPKANKPALESQLAVTANHVRNKSLELYTEQQSKDVISPQEGARRQRRSLSRPRDIIDGVNKNELADKILQELQLLSEVRNRQEQEKVAVAQQAFAEKMSNGFELPAENTATIKKVKKVKVKDKTCEDAATDCTPKVVVKKVKKVVKKNADDSEALLNNEKHYKTALVDMEPAKKESKLKRPKSYPVKELLPPAIPKPESENSFLPTKPSNKLPTALTECEDCEHSNAGLPIAVGSPGTLSRESRLVRPKSYPATKLAPPQQLKKVTRSGVAIPTITETTTPKSSSVSRQSTSEEKSTSLTPTGKLGDNSSSSDSRTTATKKSIKVPKKSKLVQPTAITPTLEEFKERAFKEKSPDKKPKGLLYAIGQKFEKLRDSAMSKEKKTTAITTTSSSSTCLAANKSSSSSDSSTPEKIRQPTLLRKKKSMDCMTPKTDKSGSITDSINSKGTKASNNSSNSEKPPKSEKRSRIDAVIRSIRERSLPRVTTPVNQHTAQLKRAVSVEEITTSFNRNAMNKVLGLFRRTDKDAVRNVRSTSNIERNVRESPESPIYQNTQAIKALAATKTTKKYKNRENYCGDSSCSCGDSLPATPATSSSITCPDCIQDEAAKKLERSRTAESTRNIVVPLTYKEPIIAQGNKDKRKGLMLELNKLEKYDTEGHVRNSAKTAYMNCNGIYSNLPPYPGAVKNSTNNSSSQHSMDNTATITTNNINNNNISINNNSSCLVNNNNNNNINNNNNNNSLLQTSSHTSGYHTSSTHEINRNHLLSPSSENIANYSSDSRSYHDDGGSTSTFLSPTEEPELYFDNWSVCSEDNYRRYATPSPTVSRLSRASQRSSPTRTGGETSDPNESVIDRIKRRSFYCRFNDKKPKRTSSIVGPNAVRDYYREQQAAIKARSSNKLNMERTDTKRATSPDITHEFFRPLKLSPVGTELKPPIYRSPLEYAMSTASRPRKSLNDIRPIITPNSTNSTSFPTRRYTTTVDRDNDYLSGISTTSSASMRYKPPTGNMHVYESPGIPSSNSNYYNTYNPKRRSSYTLNGTLPNGNSHIDGYATVGRRGIRAYDQRTLSMHDAPTTGSSSTTGYRRDTRTPVRDYSSGISRSNSRYRTATTLRSPTNI